MSRRPLVIVVVSLAVAGALFVLLGRRAPAPPPLPVAKATDTPESVAEVQPSPGPEREVVRTETYFEPVDDSKLTAEQAGAAAARYRKAARFPRTSRPLEDGLDPIARSRSPQVDYDGDEKHPEPRLLAYPSITSFEAPGDVVIYAEVVELRMAEAYDEHGRAGRETLRQFRTGARAMRGVLQTMDGAMVSPLAFHDDGTHGDAQADDDFWTATYTPDPDKPNDFRGQYQVVVQAESLKGDTLNATTAFVYSVQLAHLTGQYRDAIVDGNLQIEAEIEVEDAGRFRVEGTLVTTVDAKMIGYAYADADLEPGRHWVPLVYYGLIFHDMRAPGPYSLFSVMLSTLGGAVPQESDVVPNAYTTRAYAVDDFGDAPFNDPEYVRKADYYDGIRRTKGGK
ncbi:MAG: hypothetical protein IT293_08085 [Deltaproteobacteria bacterium]|nr:hypothetical protein [Deltaproteobacteria bacterium]